MLGITNVGFSASKPFIYVLRIENWYEMMWQEGKCGLAITSTLYDFSSTQNVRSTEAEMVFLTDVTPMSRTVPEP